MHDFIIYKNHGQTFTFPGSLKIFVWKKKTHFHLRSPPNAGCPALPFPPTTPPPHCPALCYPSPTSRHYPSLTTLSLIIVLHQETEKVVLDDSNKVDVLPFLKTLWWQGEELTDHWAWIEFSGKSVSDLSKITKMKTSFTKIKASYPSTPFNIKGSDYSKDVVNVAYNLHAHHIAHTILNVFKCSYHNYNYKGVEHK